MAQAYKTIYRVDYKRPPFTHTPSCRPISTTFENHPEGGNWYNEEASKVVSREEVERKVYRRLLKNYLTTYRLDYCGEKLYSDENVELSGNQLLEAARKIYAKGGQGVAVPGPLGTSRNILGYMSPRDFVTDLTTYQEYYGKGGYLRLMQRDQVKPTEHKTRENAKNKHKEKTVEDVLKWLKEGKCARKYSEAEQEKMGAKIRCLGKCMCGKF